ncbi:hypothetical protein DSL72_008677 [Monilinia vaccinii-corymbosi]|uniref:Uncharacterized protein n=1 Tax=Monilinia vaccinii-corymbosi TaxID=61207 RepID=A0A8A3PRS4_9HELO|nr:hypothetical protein DSL72_008677 [Monilinia vaccinii-corymbosi]
MHSHSPPHPALASSQTPGFPLPSPLTRRRVPRWTPYTLLLLTGIGLQYFYTAADSAVSTANAELKAHTDIYASSGGLNSAPDVQEQTPRIADWLVLCGGFGLLETTRGVRSWLENRCVVALGRRSLSYFLTQSVVIYSAAIPLYLHLVVDKDVSGVAATLGGGDSEFVVGGVELGVDEEVKDGRMRRV